MLILIEKLLLRCPYFFRLENILGDRPDVRPPAIYDSDSREGETTGVEGLLSAMVTQLVPRRPEKVRMKKKGIESKRWE